MALSTTAISEALSAFDATKERTAVAFSQKAASHRSQGTPAIIQFPAGGVGYISHPQLWHQDSVFVVPISAPFVISVSFVKNPFGPGGTATGTTTTDDVFADLWRQSSGGANDQLMHVWAGVTHDMDRVTAAQTIIVPLKRGDELVLKAASDGNPPRERDLREIAWTFHSLSA
jgi:hypothetical protein